LGLVVDYQDEAAVADGIARLLLEDKGTRGGFDTARRELTWEKAAQPLVAFCREPHRAADRPGRSPHPPLSPQRGGRGPETATTQRPMLSAVVLVWNGVEYIEECLGALLAQDYPHFEVLVVDNGSVDGTPELVAERFPTIKLVRNSRNLGFAVGNNVGMRAALGDLIVLLNHDTRAQPGCLAALASTFDDPSVGMAGCKLVYPDGTIQHAGGYLYGPRGEAEHFGRKAPDEGRFDQLSDPDFVTAATVMISRTAWERIGLLDEGFAPAYYEDVDWCYRARAAGFRVVYQPQAVVTHYESVTRYPTKHEQRFAMNHGRVRFLLKHHSLDQLLHEFRPAEIAWLLRIGRSEDLMAARHACLANMLALPGILDFRGSAPAEAEALMNLLADLRAAAVSGLASQAAPGGAVVDSPAEEAVAAAEQQRARLLQALRDGQTIREHVFASGVPVLGRLVVGFRNLWNSMASKWYGRAIIRQQSAFNALVVQYLQEQSLRVQEQSRALQDGSRDAAENIRELTALAEVVSRRQLGDDWGTRNAHETGKLSAHQEQSR